MLSSKPMGSGRPAVCTRVGAVEEVIRDGIDGYVIPPDDVPALIDRLAAVMDMSPEDRAEMGRRARERISDKYSIATIAHQLLDVYDDVLGHSDHR